MEIRFTELSSDELTIRYHQTNKELKKSWLKGLPGKLKENADYLTAISIELTR